MSFTYPEIIFQLRSDNQSNWAILFGLPAKRGQYPHADAVHVSQDEESVNVHHPRRPGWRRASVQKQ
jgi:hypothetical protein